MKALPHQFNDLEKLTAALSILCSIGPAAASNDGEYGMELIKGKIYSFRKLKTSIEERLEQEQIKPLGNQGFRTAARDLRRFFKLCELIDENCDPTTRGKELLASTAKHSLRNALWREAMLDLQLGTKETGVSHPYRVMLKLIAVASQIETRKLFLAFEARDDSLEEFVRVHKLSELPFADALAATHTTATSAANAVKVLPSIASQVGDISREELSSLKARHEVSEDEVKSGLPPEPFSSGSEREVVPAEIAKTPNFASVQGQAVFDLAAANEIRMKRMLKHQRTVASLAGLISNEGFSLFENPYDCLGHIEGEGSVLAEVKTLDGTAADERRQAVKALGQIKAYTFFSVSEKKKLPKIVETVAFDQTPMKETIQFLRQNRIQSAWLNQEKWFTDDGNGATLSLSPRGLLALGE